MYKTIKIRKLKSLVDQSENWTLILCGEHFSKKNLKNVYHSQYLRKCIYKLFEILSFPVYSTMIKTNKQINKLQITNARVNMGKTLIQCFW